VEDRVFVKVSLSRGEYEALKERARSLGFATVSDYLAYIARESLRGGRGEAPQTYIDVKRLSVEVSERLERRLADLINPFTAKIDEVNRRLAELIEAVESRAQQPEPVAEEERRPPAPRTPAPARSSERERGDALARLREEGVLFSEEATWIRNPEKFFRYLERKGAVVLDIGEEKIAVDPGFWERFTEAVETVEVSDSEEAARILEDELGDRAARLFRKLVRSGLASYDEDRRRWMIMLPP